MVYCPTCGAELTGNEKFCKFCGSEIGVPVTEAARPPTAPVTPARPVAPLPSAGAKVGKPKKKMKKIAIAVIVLLAIAGGSYGILVAATWGTYDQNVPFAYYASGADYDNITLTVDTSIANINISYIDPVLGAPLVQGAFQQHFVGSLIGNFEFTKSQTSKVIDLTVSHAIILFAATGYVRLNIQLLKNTSYTILAAASTGNVLIVGSDVKKSLDVTASASTGNVNVTFTNVNVTGALFTSTSTGNNFVALTRCNVTGAVHGEVSTGNVDITLTNTHVGGNLEFSASTGNADLLFQNLTIDNDAPSFWANCSTGNLDVEFQQQVELGGILTTNLETSTGNLVVSYRGAAPSTGFKGVASVSTGTVTVHPQAGFSTAMGNNIQTDNYGTATSRIDALNIHTSTGNVNVYVSSLP